MSYRMVGETCTKCRRPSYIGGLCATHYRTETPAARTHALELCKTAAGMQRTLDDIRNLPELGAAT